MSRQLKMIDSHNDEKELLLIETSGCFGNTDKTKLNFDHHKGMYGALSVLKCTSDDFSFASVEDLIKVKVFFFLNAADTHLYLWSLSYTKEGLFDLFLGASLLVRQGYESRQDYLPELVKFCLIVKKDLENSIKSVLLLRHNEASYRYTDKQGSSLADLVNPVILKLTKEEDSNG